MTGESADLDELVAMWRSLSDGVDREGVERRMFGVTSTIAVRAAAAREVFDHDAEDVVQRTCRQLVRHLQKGTPFRGAAAGWVWRVAENGALDVHRARKRRTKGKQRLRAVTLADELTDSAELQWLAEEGQQKAKWVVRRALEKMPANYRLAVEHVDIAEEPRELLEERYFRDKVAAERVDEGNAAAVAAARRRARNLVDQHLKRGRDWLRKRLARELGEEGL